MLITALLTPFQRAGQTLDRAPGGALDLPLLQRLIRFQLDAGVDRVLLGGTTGEGGALGEAERREMLAAALDVATPDQLMLGLAAGRLEDVIARGRDALSMGVRHLLLVDCPYSGASSAALRTAWHGPAAEALRDALLYPYAVPGRTGTELLPDDLAALAENHPNVVGVKDATGRLARMLRVRELCGDDFELLCGDDPQARDSLLDPNIRAHGVCSVVSNLAPAAMRALVDHARAGEAVDARRVHDDLEALFDLISVTAVETVTVRGVPLSVPQRARNPVPLKEACHQLGLDVGVCRGPLDELGPRGRTQVANVITKLERRAGPGALDGLRQLVASFELGQPECAGDAQLLDATQQMEKPSRELAGGPR